MGKKFKLYKVTAGKMMRRNLKFYCTCSSSYSKIKQWIIAVKKK